MQSLQAALPFLNAGFACAQGKEPGLQLAARACGICQPFCRPSRGGRGHNTQQAHCCFQTAHQSDSALGVRVECSRADAIATLQNPVPVHAGSAGCSGGNSSVCPLSSGNALLFRTQPREANRELRSVLETPLQQISSAWEFVGEQHPLLLQQAALPAWQMLFCSLPALRLPALLELPPALCPGMPAHRGRTQWFPLLRQARWCPPGEPSSLQPPLCPVPFLKG